MEEQFYVEWLLLFFAVLAVAAKSGAGRKSQRSVLAGVLIAFGVLSFRWAMVETHDYAAWGFTSPQLPVGGNSGGCAPGGTAPAFAKLNQGASSALGALASLALPQTLP